MASHYPISKTWVSVFTVWIYPMQTMYDWTFLTCHILQTTSAFRWKWNKLYSIFVVYFWNNIYAFSICFYPKRLTVHSGYTSFLSVCVPWELNPQTFALLTQCSTTEPQKHSNMYTSKYIGMYNVRLNRSWRSSTFKNESLQISSP